jgi:D-cysteine desulfhydrase
MPLPHRSLSAPQIRKLDFLLADAVAKGCDSVVTIGGAQSNHCRATAAAARMIGLQPHLILRVPDASLDVGLGGNLLFDRILGADIHLVSRADYRAVGSDALLRCGILSLFFISALALFKLTDEAKSGRSWRRWGRSLTSSPSEAPTRSGPGGILPPSSSPLLPPPPPPPPRPHEKSYIEFVEELRSQGDLPSDIVMACGSGGTAAGLASTPPPPSLWSDARSAGLRMAGASTKLHAVIVCDDKGYFQNHIDGIFKDLKVGGGV